MFMKKDRVLLTMKCFAALFLAFMLTKSLTFIADMPYEDMEQTMEEIKGKYEGEICNTNWLFLVYAFVLGAFWNVQKLRKVGVV